MRRISAAFYEKVAKAPGMGRRREPASLAGNAAAPANPFGAVMLRKYITAASEAAATRFRLGGPQGAFTPPDPRLQYRPDANVLLYPYLCGLGRPPTCRLQPVVVEFGLWA
jgi:hypothetical protein